MIWLSRLCAIDVSWVCAKTLWRIVQRIHLNFTFFSWIQNRKPKSQFRKYQERINHFKSLSRKNLEKLFGSGRNFLWEYFFFSACTAHRRSGISPRSRIRHRLHRRRPCRRKRRAKSWPPRFSRKVPLLPCHRGVVWWRNEARLCRRSPIGMSSFRDHRPPTPSSPVQPVMPRNQFSEIFFQK